MQKYKKIIVKAFNDGVAVLKLDKVKMASLAEDRNATKVGIVILALPFVLNSIISATLMSSFFFLYVKLLIVSAIVSFGSIFVLGLVAQKVFNAKGSLIGLFRVVSHAGILMILTVIPFILAFVGSFSIFNLSGLISLAAYAWALVVVYNVLLHQFKMSSQEVVLTIIISVVIMVIFQSLIGSRLIGSYYGFFY